MAQARVIAPLPVEHSDTGLGKVQPLRHAEAEREQLLWARLRSAETPEEFYGAWLGLQCGIVEDVKSGLVVAALQPGGPLEPVASWPEGSKHGRHLLVSAERVASERRALALQLDPQGRVEEARAARTVIARPVDCGEEVSAVVVLEVTPRPAAELEHALRQLAWGSAWLQVHEMGGREAAGAAPS